MAEKKDTIYIDVDDEITAIIDKLEKSDSKIVALVLPKRTTALQSIVNMKLLKRAAKENGKSPVLITSEKGLLPLAGATGFYTAKNLQSKPEIPPAPETFSENSDEEEAVDKTAAVGELAGSLAASDTIDMEQEDVVAANAAEGLENTSSKKSKKAKGNSSPKIPNFEKFRKSIFLVIGGLLALIALWYVAVVVLPKAKIIIEADTESVNSSFEFIASPSATTVEEDQNKIPAKLVSEKKEDTQSAPATGQKDLGAKASGNMTFSIPCASVSGTPPTVPAGTGVSANGLTYITQNNASLTTPSFGGGCSFVGTTTVIAQNNGEQYNIGAATYTVSGYSNVSGKGSEMSGGSSKIARVVSDQDVSVAKNKIETNDENSKKKLQQELKDGDYFVIDSSFKKANESIIPTPAVGQEGSEVKVTYSADFTMLGVKRDELKRLIEASIKDQIDTDQQKLQDDGLDQATFTVKSVAENGDTVIALSTSVEVGPDIDTEALKKEVRGKKSGETENIIQPLPGVKDVEVNYSPFWVSRTPKKDSKITIQFKSANQN